MSMVGRAISSTVLRGSIWDSVEGKERSLTWREMSNVVEYHLVEDYASDDWVFRIHRRFCGKFRSFC